VSRALGVLAKVAFFLLVVVVGLFLFRPESRRPFTDWWAMRKCPELVQADIQLLTPWSEAKVERCEGTVSRATCAVTTTEKSGRKTAPVKDWDCTRRHITADFYEEFAKAALEARNTTTFAASDGQNAQAKAREMLARTLKVKDDFVESIRYVNDKLRERYETLCETGEIGETGPSGGPPGLPGGFPPGFPIR